MNIALLGESNAGKYSFPYFLKDFIHIYDMFGNPKKISKTIEFALQAIAYERQIIFFRVKKEGYSIDDYEKSFKILKNKNKIKTLDAICMPKVGDQKIIDLSDEISDIYNSLLIINEKDLFDYLISL